MITKLLFSAVALALSGSAFAHTDAAKSSRAIAATLEGEAAERAFFSINDYQENLFELHGLVITHRSNASMSCREAIRNNSAKYSCVVFTNDL